MLRLPLLRLVIMQSTTFSPHHYVLKIEHQNRNKAACSDKVQIRVALELPNLLNFVDDNLAVTLLPPELHNRSKVLETGSLSFGFVFSSLLVLDTLNLIRLLVVSCQSKLSSFVSWCLSIVLFYIRGWDETALIFNAKNGNNAKMDASRARPVMNAPSPRAWISCKWCLFLDCYLNSEKDFAFVFIDVRKLIMKECHLKSN